MLPKAGWVLRAMGQAPVSFRLPVPYRARFYEGAPGRPDFVATPKQIPRQIAGVRHGYGQYTKLEQGGGEVQAVIEVREAFGAALIDWVRLVAPCVTQVEALAPVPMVFPASPDWEEGIKERLGWFTDVIVADDDTEQRLRLRTYARRTLAFSALLLDAEEVAFLDSLLWRNQAGRWAVPLWMDANPLVASAAVGAGSIWTPWEGTAFTAGSKGVLWKSTTEWEEFAVLGLNAGQIMLQDPLVKAWDADSTLVIPTRTGRMLERLSINRPATFASESGVIFSLEMGE